MKPEIVAVLVIFVVFSATEFVRTGFFTKKGQRRKDGIVEVISTTMLFAVTQPTVLLAGGLLAAAIFPGQGGVLEAWPIAAQVGLLLIFDDMTQYWWHRLNHNVKWLYELHRPHHDAEYMSIRIVYRNNIFYYFMTPGIWFSGALIYLGVGKVYVFYLVIKLLVICGAHSDVRWDKPLYKIAWLSPLVWLKETRRS